MSLHKIQFFGANSAQTYLRSHQKRCTSIQPGNMWGMWGKRDMLDKDMKDKQEQLESMEWSELEDSEESMDLMVLVDIQADYHQQSLQHRHLDGHRLNNKAWKTNRIVYYH